jgi:ADP-ribose pyrophosphatase
MDQTPTQDPRVEVLEKTTPYSGFFSLDLYRLRHKKFDGDWTREISREVLERGHAAAVLPYDPKRDLVVLIEQFRVGALAAGMEPWTIEIVAGIIDQGETPEEVARREAGEEADLAVEELVPIGRFLTSAGGSSETHQLYCGRIDSEGAGGIHGLQNEEEDIRVFACSLNEALGRIECGEITNFTAAVALQWLALNKERLQREWTP